jgi:hypothetical protein
MLRLHQHHSCQHHCCCCCCCCQLPAKMAARPQAAVWCLPCRETVGLRRAAACTADTQTAAASRGQAAAAAAQLPAARHTCTPSTLHQAATNRVPAALGGVPGSMQGQPAQCAASFAAAPKIYNSCTTGYLDYNRRLKITSRFADNCKRHS